MQQMAKVNFEEINLQLTEPLKKEQSWYLLDKKWFDKCKQFNETGDEQHFPGPIDNEDLFSDSDDVACCLDSRSLNAGVSEQQDFVLVPQKTWDTLKQAYGLKSISHCIKREVIQTGPKDFVVEILPIKLKLCLYGAKEGTVEKAFSRRKTMGEVGEEMKKEFNVGVDKQIKIWVHSADLKLCIEQQAPTKASSENGSYSTNNKSSTNGNSNNSSTTLTSSFDNLSPSTASQQAKTITTNGLNTNLNFSSTIEEVGLISNAIVTLEVINNDGTWPSCKPRYGAGVTTRSTKSQPGLCGLSNMGNTCFMNSALQCLSNTPPLTNFILEGKFIKDINVDNPLGMRGEIARTYAELIKVIWSGNCTHFMPREFKCAVSTFAPQFTGFAQQDCQELMAFLLDGLHEDLNRIRNKPYIEIKNEIERRPDEIVAEESWSNYKKRNDSVVVDTFHALLKSTLVCPGCNLVSVTFDPFCYLSLPLPVKRDLSRQITSTSVSSAPSSDSIETFSPEVLQKSALQLEDCITQFTNVEKLGASDPWYCPRCKKHQQATKKFDIWTLPKVLIIHLKRFSFSRSWRDKIDTLVEFPVVNLDMSKYVLSPEQKKSGKAKYNLIAVANHFGGLGGGHYTAYAKNHPNGNWYTFDDALVSPTTPANIVTRSAYVLFYQLQD